MEYAAELEENAKAQAERIIELEARMDGQTVLTDTTDYAASAVATGTNKEMSDIKSMSERRKIEGEKSQEHFEISIVFRKDLHPHTLEIPQGGETNTRTDSSFIADMEYTAALEEKSIV